MSLFYFPASGQAVVSGVAPSPPRYVPSILSRIGFSIPTAHRFSSNVAKSRSRAFRESICAQEKAPRNLYEYAHGGIRTHAIDLLKYIIAGTRITCYHTGLWYTRADNTIKNNTSTRLKTYKVLFLQKKTSTRY